ncbi:phage holin family protein [Aliarcobacter vitoriensis]|uniref:Uncharacterized protein n=1 Tax=Aliarcobacter vitoriensis TaxID=2011099 RepID=A0A366MRE4_9BACT|nr:phage holin family protein [Aliarcobacter vitoriensis]RBQ28413.1 hypothetical protein CRU91_09335 [Aliarcobacter vitoriensis]
MKFDDFLFMLYLAVISFLAGVIGLINRAEHKSKERLKDRFLFLWSGGISSVFIGFVAYEICFYFTENQRFCVAVSAFCAWIGTKLLLEAQTRALDFIQNYKKRS